MSDYNSALPIRTEGDATEKVQVRILDHTTDSQKLGITADSEAKVQVQGDNPAGGVEILRLSELGAPNGDGFYDVTNNTKPDSSGLIAHTRAATPADTDQVKRITAITNGSVHALDVSLHDEAGAAYSSSNPMPVVMVESEGAEINDFKQASAIAAAASDNHDYTVSGGTTLMLTQIEGAASGKAKMEVKVETGVGTGIYTTKFVKFNSTANPNMSVILKEPIAVAAGVKVRVTMTNLDNQAQDLYSTIAGHEV